MSREAHTLPCSTPSCEAKLPHGHVYCLDCARALAAERITRNADADPRTRLAKAPAGFKPRRRPA